MTDDEKKPAAKKPAATAKPAAKKPAAGNANPATKPVPVVAPAGVETQPAVHAYAAESTKGDERVDAGYALVLPLAMILKLILVQLLI